MKNLQYIILFFVFVSCDLSENTVGIEEKKQYQIELIYSVEITVPEPSGLTLSKDKKHLYTVSDQTGEIFKLNLNGDVLQTIKLSESLDLEGICQDNKTNDLWIVEEQSRELLKVDLSGNILKRKIILDGNDNSGLEGICYSPNGNLILIKEKDPAYFIELDSLLNTIVKEELVNEPDYSGIIYDSEIKQYFILSQKSKKILFYTKDSGFIGEINLPMEQAEGIAYNSETNILYIVDDNESKLYKFLFSIITK